MFIVLASFAAVTLQGTSGSGDLAVSTDDSHSYGGDCFDEQLGKVQDC